MKIEGTGRTAAKLALASYARRTAAADTARPAEPPEDLAVILGIPEAELTPKVREAIGQLMAEVDALRRELSDTKTRLEQAEAHADQDDLLPVLNRRAFVRELSRAIAGAARYGTDASLIYFDLNGFKQVNDAHGHAAGDAVLAHFSRTICEQVRDSDVVGRIGGDEFAVILNHAGEIAAHRKAEVLANTLSVTPAQWQDMRIPIGFSYGAIALKPGSDATQAIAQADAAMYAHKRAAGLTR